jgi:hypothetical protein
MPGLLFMEISNRIWRIFLEHSSAQGWERVPDYLNKEERCSETQFIYRPVGPGSVRTGSGLF